MAYVLEFELPGLPRTLNDRGHWRVRHAENQKWLKLVAFATSGKRPPVPLERARLTLTRMSSREPDFDNRVSGFKPIVDALVRCGVLVDDKMSNIGSPEFLWEKAKPKHGGVRVRIEEGI